MSQGGLVPRGLAQALARCTAIHARADGSWWLQISRMPGGREDVPSLLVSTGAPTHVSGTQKKRQRMGPAPHTASGTVSSGTGTRLTRARRLSATPLRPDWQGRWRDDQ